MFVDPLHVCLGCLNDQNAKVHQVLGGSVSFPSYLSSLIAFLLFRAGSHLDFMFGTWPSLYAACMTESS